MAAAKWQPARDFGDRHMMRDGVGAACAVAALGHDRCREAAAVWLMPRFAGMPVRCAQ